MPVVYPSLQTVGNYGYISSERKYFQVYTATLCTSNVTSAGGNSIVLCAEIGPI